MSAEEYWRGETWLASAYYKADRLRQDRENANAWLYGGYVVKAIEATIGNIFREKGTPPDLYPSSPIGLSEDQREKEKREEDEATYALAYMTNMVLAGKNWGKRK